MKKPRQYKEVLCLIMMIAVAMALCACSSRSGEVETTAKQDLPDRSHYVVAVEDEPDTVDFQCTTIHYTIATNVFNRLVETVVDEEGEAKIEPSLAESWEVSEDGRTYTFKLRDDVRFTNGNKLTSSDVLYSFSRLLTYPESCNQDIVDIIEGASELESGEAKELAGFKVLNDREFSITLKEPFSAFLACLSMPAASILDEESTKAAGKQFGKDPKATIGTGSYIMEEWEPGEGMILSANKDCWMGPPNNDGLDLRFMAEPEEVRVLFEDGVLNVLDLDEVESSAEYFLHGDIYQDRIHKVSRIGINYIALNETVEPLNDVRVRKALQYALDRQVLLDAVYNGQGSLEQGIFPKGLYGFNPDLPEIPYDKEKAKKLLAEAGYPDGFDLTISMKNTSPEGENVLMRLVSSMWEEIGVHARIKVTTEDEFMENRKAGKLACYSATWTADYDDPDNFIYTFYGNKENTTFRSLCYQNEKIMKRVQDARTIGDPDKRLKEYRELEKKIIQDDAAWIPLFSRLRMYVTAEGVEGFHTSWNGSVKNEFRWLTVNEPEKSSE